MDGGLIMERHETYAAIISKNGVHVDTIECADRAEAHKVSRLAIREGRATRAEVWGAFQVDGQPSVWSVTGLPGAVKLQAFGR